MAEEKNNEMKDLDEAVETKVETSEKEEVSTDIQDPVEKEQPGESQADMATEEDATSSKDARESADTESSDEPVKEVKSNKTLLIGGAIAVAVAIALYVIFGGSMMATTKVSSNEAAAAIVNGVVVSEEELKTQIADVESFYAAQGQPLTEEIRSELRAEALEALIGQELILQQAQVDGYAATDEDAEAMYNSEVVSYYGSDEAVIAALTTAGATKEQLLDDLAKRITINNFIDNNIDIESIVISDEEAQEVYDVTAADFPDVPPFEEVVEEIKSQLQQQAITDEIMALVDTLKATADIEIQ